MFGKKNKEKIFCGLDIGSQTIKAGLLKWGGEDHFEILGAYQQRTQGFKDGTVSDLDEFSECVYTALSQLGKRAEVKIKDVHIGVNSQCADIRKADTMIPLIERGSKVITRRDVKKINTQAHLLGMKVEEDVIHDLPQHYQIDDDNFVSNPVGLYGRKLGVHLLIVASHVSRIRNLTKAVHQAGYDIQHLSWTPYSTAAVALTEREKDDGVVLIDVGAQMTTLLIFKEKGLKYLDKIHFGGDHFTLNLAEKVNLPFDLAEEIKRSSYADLTSRDHLDEEVLIKRDSAYVPIRREQIFSAMEPQLDHLIDLIKTSLGHSELSNYINAGVVLTGGGILLAGLIERIEQDVFSPVRIATFDFFKQQKSSSNAAMFLPALALAHASVDDLRQANHFSHDGQGWPQRAGQVIKDLYQEYF